MSDYQFELFQQSWSIYQQILDANYMFHREISSELNQFCQRYFAGQAIKLIDLGCGDASQSIPVMNSLTIKHYTACDVSQIALDLAAVNLDQTAWPYSLNCQDMLTGLNTLNHTVDLIYCSFSMHHLNTAQKQQLFTAASRVLNQGGLFLLVDVVRDEEQTLSNYHQAYLDYAQQHWTQINSNDFATLSQHVSSSDLPEPFSQLKALAKQAGFNHSEILTKHTWHASSVFYKS